MRFKHVLVPSTLALAVGLGFAQQSAASVYARSYSALSDLTVVLSDDGGVTPGPGGSSAASIFSSPTPQP